MTELKHFTICIKAMLKYFCSYHNDLLTFSEGDVILMNILMNNTIKMVMMMKIMKMIKMRMMFNLELLGCIALPPYGPRVAQSLSEINESHDDDDDDTKKKRKNMLKRKG